MAKKATLVTKAVAWTNDKPNKYQSFLEYPVSNKRTIRICGDPKPTEELALDSLTAEFMLWDEAMIAFKTELNN